MATFRLSAKIIGRKAGQSAVAAAAYRSGTSLREERTGEIKDYTARHHAVAFTGIFAPKDAPDWVHDREQLWNRVEAFEKRKDAQLTREFQIALPHELNAEQRQWLVQDFVREQFTRRGYVADVAIHAPDRDGDERNHHAHVMVTTRTVDKDGFAAIKDRSLNDRQQLYEWREDWANLANRHLARHGIEARIDHRSHADRGLEEEPTKYEGPNVTEMARRGIGSDRRQENDEIRLRNAARAQLAADRALASADLVAIDTTPSQDEEERSHVAPATTFVPGSGMDWTSRGGMVAQQASANIWARDAELQAQLHGPGPQAPRPVLRPQRPEQGDEAPTPSTDEINRQQAAERQQLAASPVATQATEAARQGEDSPAPSSAPTRSAQETERDEILAAFDRTYAKSLQNREQEHEQGGGRELDR